MRNTLLAFLVFALPLLLPAQTTQTFSNSTSSILDDAIGYDPNNYPSKIEITGMPGRLHEFAVRFMLLTGSFPDLDLLLEAPNGQRILLSSDLPYPFFDSYDFGIGSTGKDTLSPNTINDLRVFYPVNYDDGAPDIFPSPGPGVMVQSAYPDPLALQDIDPNGEWKLYLVDDTPNGSSTWLLDGWTLEITAGDLPACKRPGKASAATQDFSATLGWAAGAGNTQWDLIVTPDLSLEPVDSTTPTHPGLLQNQNVVVNSLESGLSYAAFVRADCGGGRTSPWVGPAIFKTTIHPCDMATSIGLCQTVDYPTLPYYQNFFFDPGQKVWVFAFTPPDPGDYWMQFEGGGGGYLPYYRLNNLNNCEDGQWTPMEKNTGVLDGQYRMPNLAAGQTCWIIYHEFNLAQQSFRIERCPLRRISLIGVHPFTDSLLVDLEPAQNLGNSLDLYFGVKPLPSPDENTAPTYTGQSLTYVPGGYNYVFRNLLPDTEYEFYVRRGCTNGDASCWQGPFSGKTKAVCSTIKSVHVDTTTYTWADITFSFDSIPLRWELAVCRPGQNPSHERVGLSEVNALNDTMTVRLKNLPLTTPLQLYFKAHCLGQSWQGPYDIPAGATPPLPIRDLYCMEAVYTDPETTNSGYDSYIEPAVICGGDLGERIFRYRANQTDTVAITYNGGCGNCNVAGGCGFYYKSASKLPDIEDWNLIGCWTTPATTLPALKLPVEKDSVYYILCNSFKGSGSGGSGLTTFYFKMNGCTVTCPTVDSIALETISPTSAVLRWNNAAPGGYYELRYFPVSGAQPPVSVTTNDTALILTGLLAAAPYTFQIRSFCSPTDPGGLRTVTIQLAKHTVTRKSFIGRCNPRFLPPGGTKPATYDVFDLDVPESGDYRLINGLETYLYEGAFDPDNSTLHLLVAVPITGNGAHGDTLVPLQAGKAYKWVISHPQSYPVISGYNSNGYDNISISVAGPGPAQIGAAQWKGAEPKPHGKIPLQVNSYHGGACRDTSGWVHYYIQGNQSDAESDALLLSLKTGVDPEILDNLPMAFFNDPPSAVLIKNPPAEFVQNPDGFYEMNRFWGMLDLLPSQQIDEDFLIRFYYTQADYELLKTAIEAAGGKLDSHEAMYFHKINGFHDYSNLAPFYNHIFVPRALAYDADGYWQYANGPEATPSTWRHGTHEGEYYAEMVIRGFSGGGGGASVNGKSVFDPVSKTTEPGANRVFNLSPNPNAGVFNIEMSAPAEPGAGFRITDPGGRLWREQPVAAGSKRQTVQAGDLPAGLYFLQVVAEGKVLAAERFVKL